METLAFVPPPHNGVIAGALTLKRIHADEFSTHSLIQRVLVACQIQYVLVVSFSAAEPVYAFVNIFVGATQCRCTTNLLVASECMTLYCIPNVCS